MRTHRALLRTLLALVVVTSKALAGGQLVYVAKDIVQDPALAARLATYGGDDAQRFVLRLTGEEQVDGVDWCLAPESDAVDDVDLTRRLRAADVLVLQGGQFMEWYDTVYPPGRRTRLARALQDFVQTSKPIVAYGGACAFLSGGVSVPVEALRKPERNPRRTGAFRARVALGVGARAMFDADTWSEGSPLRLVRALHSTHLDHGFYFLGDVALELQRDPPQLRVLGPGEVLAFDLGRARRQRTGVDHARLARLVDGDIWGLANDRVELSEARERHPDPAVGPDEVEGPELAPTGAALASWLAQHAAAPRRASIRRLAAGAPDRSVPHGAAVRWSLGWDSGAAGWAPTTASSRDTWVGIPFTCDWRAR